jgi:hypothetical protein
VPSPAPAKGFQLRLNEREAELLAAQIEDNYQSAESSHLKRMERYAGYLRRWRSIADPPKPGKKKRSTIRVPLLKWQLYARWAQVMQSLFGDDAQIVAAGKEPTDDQMAESVSAFLTDALIDRMDKAMQAWTELEFFALLFGRAHAYAPWVERYFMRRETPGDPTSDKRELAYAGPSMQTIHPKDLVLPAEDGAKSIHDFSFVIRLVPVRLDDLVAMEDEGLVYGIRENFAKIAAYARSNEQRETYASQVQFDLDTAQGTSIDNNTMYGTTLLLREWYGYRRLDTSADGSAAADSGEVVDAGTHRDAEGLPQDGAGAGLSADDDLLRMLPRRHLLVRYLPGLRMVIGCQDLADLYPQAEQRRPFVERSLVHDGSYWGPGLGELLAELEDEQSATRRLFTDSMRFSCGPILLYKPGYGLDEVSEIEPGMKIPSQDPSQHQLLQLKADLAPVISQEQAIQSYAEQVTGVNGNNMGRAIDRPNAPKTATGMITLVEQGEVRLSLDTRIMRAQMSEQILPHFWRLYQQFGEAGQFFRVSGKRFPELFSSKGGFAKLTGQEFQASFDFKMQFATSVIGKAIQESKDLQLYSLDLQNPLIVQNPAALWEATNRVHAALGDRNFERTVPKPAQPDMPKDPDVEWSLMLRGKDVSVSPADNDQLHLEAHEEQLRLAVSMPPERRDADAERRLVMHYQEQKTALEKKQLMQAMMSAMVDDMAAGRPPIPPGIIPGLDMMLAQGGLGQQAQQGGMPPESEGMPGNPAMDQMMFGGMGEEAGNGEAPIM